MRVFALSDLHLDYTENRMWISGLSNVYYRSDWLILAGDISDDVMHIEWCFVTLGRKFQKIFFVSGNHDLWVRQDHGMTSLDKFDLVNEIARQHGVSIGIYHDGTICIVPQLGWYDFSFGSPGQHLQQHWLDFSACAWPVDMEPISITNHFLDLNRQRMTRFLDSVVNQADMAANWEMLISFSHFVPRIDVMLSYIHPDFRFIYPVLGSLALDAQLRGWQARQRIHLYGHSHVNRFIFIDGTNYINNAFGYPSEKSICRKELLCIYEGADGLRS